MIELFCPDGQHLCVCVCVCVCLRVSVTVSVSVSVYSTGQVTGLQRGPTTEKWEYDLQGRIVSRVFADGKTWGYTYLDKVNTLILSLSLIHVLLGFICSN